MPPRIGYLLPTREQVMQGRPEAPPLLALAERAEGLGYDSIWVGDSILARPRHEPLTLLSAVAARTRKAEFGTAVLLPARRAAAEPAPSGKPGTDARSAENGGRKAASNRSDILLVVGSRRAICESRDRAGGSIQ